MTSSGMSTADDDDDNDGDDNGRVAATDEMDSSADEISGSCVFCFLLDDIIVRCGIVRGSCLYYEVVSF